MQELKADSSKPVETEPVLEVGAENSEKLDRCQEASTHKRRHETLRLKLSGCVKYFAEEATWAITNHSMCDFWIERKEFQPGCYSGFAVFAKNTSGKNSSAKQIGWVREDDKPLFLECTHSIDDIEELSIELSNGVIRRENRGIEIVITVSK